MKKKHFSILVTLFIVIFLLASCGGDDDTAEPTEAPEVATAAPEEEAEEPEEAEEAMAEELSAVLLPKFLGILVFDQAYEGALEAAEELGADAGLEFLGPTAENSVEGQIEILTTATTQGVDAIMISNNAGD